MARGDSWPLTPASLEAWVTASGFQSFSDFEISGYGLCTCTEYYVLFVPTNCVTKFILASAQLLEPG